MIDVENINKELEKLITQSYFLETTDEVIDEMTIACTEILYEHGFCDDKEDWFFNPVIIGVNLEVKIVDNNIQISYRSDIDTKVVLRSNIENKE